MYENPQVKARCPIVLYELYKQPKRPDDFFSNDDNDPFIVLAVITKRNTNEE